MVKYKVKIGHRTVRIHEQEKVVSPDDQVCHGLSNSATGDIYISTEDTKNDLDMRKETIIHELLHMMSDIYYINLKETQVGALAVVLTEFLKDNPKFVKEEIV